MLKRHAVVLIEPRLSRRLVVDRDRALCRLEQIGDQSQQRRLATTRWADQRNELARLDLQVDVVQRIDLFRSAGIEHLVHRLNIHGKRHENSPLGRLRVK